MSQWIGAVLLLGGSIVCLFAAIGVLRLPDFFMRMHAATKAGVAGAGLVLLGVAAFDGSTATWIKAMLAVFFLLVTTPVAGHLIGRAGYVSGVPLWRGTSEDALDGVLPRTNIIDETPDDAPDHLGTTRAP
ncbi:MAG: monovalent cation/H(+) antiporter subunit G [Burkholderiaceae bacterium]